MVVDEATGWHTWHAIGVPSGIGTSVDTKNKITQNTLGGFVAGLAVAAVLATSTPARAEIAVDAGGFATNGTFTGGAALSIGVLAIPLTPIAVELTGAVPIGAGGGYAATADVRAKLFGTTLGAGAGIGTIGNKATTGVIYDGIISQSILPHIALEVREYLGPNRRSSFFAGVRLSI